MDEMEAAKQLYASLKMQKGTFNVVPLPDKQHGFRLKVWVAPGMAYSPVPEFYLGFPVDVVVRPSFKANAGIQQ